MDSGWLRLVGRGLLGFTLGVGLDALALWLLRSGYYLFPLGHLALPLVPILVWLRPGWHITFLVVAPAWAVCWALIPALAPPPRRVVLFLVLGCHVHALLMPKYIFRPYDDPLIHAALLAYCVLLFAGSGGLYWSCREPGAEA